MSKRSYIFRYSLLLSRLREKPYSSYKELDSFISRKLEFLREDNDQLNMAFSKRTFERDIREIRSMFGVDIEYSKKRKGYFIAGSEAEEESFQRLIETFDIFNSLKLSKDIGRFIHLEKRQPRGTEHLYGFLHAIKNNLVIRFIYKKFWEDEISHRAAEPYALKEFKNRWYLMARDRNDKRVKTFALDRISELDITTNIFEVIEKFDVEKSYRHCFGIINPSDQRSEMIILSFDPFQGKYIKTLPLHDTQKILIDNEDELRISLQLMITHDFIMELLSFGDNMKVIEPASLAEEIKEAHKKSFLQYS